MVTLVPIVPEVGLRVAYWAPAGVAGMVSNSKARMIAKAKVRKILHFILQSTPPYSTVPIYHANHHMISAD